MKRPLLFILALLAVCAFTFAPTSAFAQDDEGPENRVMTVTKLHVPFAARSTLVPWMQKYFFPAWQLNPNIINFRLMWHFWGKNAADMVLVAEYANWEAINADCGQPCDDWDEANPTPEEGEAGYEEYAKGLEMFQKYYGHHGDEIYTVIMDGSRVEGAIVGTVGPSDDDDDN